VDRKRQSDKEVISEHVKKAVLDIKRELDRALNSSSPTRSTTSRLTTPPTTQTPVTDGFSYTIQKDDTLSAIVQAYNAHFKSKGQKTITQKQVIDANLKVNWNRLIVGQKIIIPAPPGAN
jgi:LysM repeat protein